MADDSRVRTVTGSEPIGAESKRLLFGLADAFCLFVKPALSASKTRNWNVRLKMAGEGNGADFSTRVEKLKRFESERGALVAGLIADYEELSVKYAQKCTDYQDELESRRLYQTKARRLEQTSVCRLSALCSARVEY